MIDNLSTAVYTFPHAYVDITFNRWDIATKVYDLIY